MRSTPVLVVLSLSLAAAAPAAQADTTTTQTLNPGETMRSSPDASPSPATPVIVTLVARPQQSPTTFTITLKDKHDRARGTDVDGGPNGFNYVGPQVNITASPDPGFFDATYDVDSSAYTPDFVPVSGGINGNRFFYFGNKPGASSTDYSMFGSIQQRSDGMYRLTVAGGGAFGPSFQPGEFDLVEQSWYVKSYYDFTDDSSLDTALAKGVGIVVSGNYQASVKAKITVSPSVAKRLHLKSTTIGSKNYPKGPKVSGRIKLTSAARKALKKYKKVVVYVETASTGPGGEVITKRSKATLTTKKANEDDELG